MFFRQASLSFEFCMGKSTICDIVREVSEAIWMALSEEFVKLPSTEEEWLAVSREYEKYGISQTALVQSMESML